MSELLVENRVRAALAGTNPFVISKLSSGWLVAGDVQPLPGYCLLLADPIVDGLNSLDAAGRDVYLRDMVRCGGAILAATGAERMNYETWGNTDPWLHTHLMPRYGFEPPEKRRMPACMVYSWAEARMFSAETDGEFVGKVKEYLAATP